MLIQDWESPTDTMISVPSQPLCPALCVYQLQSILFITIDPFPSILFFEVFFFNATMIKALFYSKQKQTQISKL